MLVSLSEVASLVRGVTTTRFKAAPQDLKPTVEVGLYQIADLHSLESKNPKDVLRVEKSEIKRYLLHTGDVLVSLVGAPLKASVVTSDRTEIAGANVGIVQPFTHLINPYFLAIVLRSESVTRQVEQRLTGTTVPHFALDALKQINIPFLRLEQQASIVSAVKTQQEFERNLQECLDRERALSSARLEYLLHRDESIKETR